MVALDFISTRFFKSPLLSGDSIPSPVIGVKDAKYSLHPPSSHPLPRAPPPHGPQKQLAQEPYKIVYPHCSVANAGSKYWFFYSSKHMGTPNFEPKPSRAYFVASLSTLSISDLQGK